MFRPLRATLRSQKMYNEGKLYSARSLVVVHILNFERDLVVMRFIRIELITCSTSDKHEKNYCYTSQRYQQTTFNREKCN